MKFLVLLFSISTFSFAFGQSTGVKQNTLQQKTIKQTVQTSDSNSELSKPDDSVTTGFRVGISRPKYSAATIAGYNYGSGIMTNTEDPDVDYTNVLKFGYEYLPVKSFGYIADFDFIESRIEGQSLNIVRLQGYGAYSFNKYVNFHAGLNVADLVSKGASKFDRGIGKQFGIGYQFNKHFAFEFNYCETNLSATIPVSSTFSASAADFATVDVQFRGFDLSVIGNF